MNEKPIVIIAGMGQGLGHTLAQYFGNKGYQVIGFNRSKSNETCEHITEFQLDLADEAQVKRVSALVLERFGVPNVLIHNTAELVIAPFEETSFEQFERCWRSATASAFHVAQAFLPTMTRAGGTMIVSGATASLRGGANFSAFSASKFALRGLVQSLARTYQSQGVHVVHVLLDGIIDTPKSRTLHQQAEEKMLNPTHIAESYWYLANQPTSAWTHELDLRPFSENF